MIVSLGQAKNVPYPQRLIGNSFKDDVSCLFFVLKLTLPCHWAIGMDCKSAGNVYNLLKQMCLEILFLC
jgi:hypothetical protein